MQFRGGVCSLHNDPFPETVVLREGRTIGVAAVFIVVQRGEDNLFGGTAAPDGGYSALYHYPALPGELDHHARLDPQHRVRPHDDGIADDAHNLCAPAQAFPHVRFPSGDGQPAGDLQAVTAGIIL